MSVKVRQFYTPQTHIRNAHQANLENSSTVKLSDYTEDILQASSQEKGIFQSSKSSSWLGFWALTFFLPMGCGNENKKARQKDPPKPKWDEIGTRSSDALAFENVELEGLPGHGEIHYFQMVHLPPKKVKTIHEQEPWRFRDTGLQHWEILKGLEKLQPEHLFMEGVYPSKDPERFPLIPTIDSREDIRKAFAQGLGEEPTQDQIWYLARNTAGPIYQILHPEVKTYPTMNQSLRKDLYQAMKDMKARGIRAEDNHPDFLEPVKYQRERFVVSGMAEILRNQNKPKIVLVFGGGHDFTDDLEGLESSPRLVSYFYELLFAGSYEKVERVRQGLPQNF